MGNLSALDLILSEDDLKAIDSIVALGDVLSAFYNGNWGPGTTR